MKRTHKSGAQKQRDKKKKLAEAARNSRSLSSWLGHQSHCIQSETFEKAARNRDGSTTAEADWVNSATAEAEQVSSATAEAEPVNEDVSTRATQSMYRCCKISISMAWSRRKTPKKRNDPCTVKSSPVERFVLKNGAP